MSRNLEASIRTRLKQRADAKNQDFNLTLTYYALERLLYRLSISRHAQSFVLKGALLFTLWYDLPHRPTRDADLLGFGPDDLDSVAAAFRDICSIAVDDGIHFDVGSVRATQIREEAGYGGVRIELRAGLQGARISVQVDIGFGDVVTPPPETVMYSVLLADLPSPCLRAYPKYTVVAEKYHAICVLGMANSRMKDYFDLWVLLRAGDLDDSELVRAIRATFVRRSTALPEGTPMGLTEAFAMDPGKQAQWRAFVARNSLDTVPLEGKAIKLVGAADSPQPPQGRNAYAWHLQEKRADMFLGYCTSGRDVVKEMQGARVVQLPKELATGADYGLTVMNSSVSLAAVEFARYMQSERGRNILREFGFEVP